MQQRNGATHENARDFTMNKYNINDIVGHTVGTQNILTVSGVTEEQGFIEITKDEYPGLYKIVSKCASLPFGLNERYLSSSEDELRALIKGFKCVNDCTIAQAAMWYQVGNELNRRIAEERSAAKKSLADEYAEFERTGLWANGSPFPKVGDTVEYDAHGIIGHVVVYKGEVIKGKDGDFKVRYNYGVSKGGKTVTKLTKLTPSWIIVKN